MTTLIITARNAEAVTGMPWAACKRFARSHGVRVARLSHRCDAIDAAVFMAAVRREATTTAPAPRPVARDEYDQILIDLGVLR